MNTYLGGCVAFSEADVDEALAAIDRILCCRKRGIFRRYGSGARADSSFEKSPIKYSAYGRDKKR
jgi:hypothetical protein